MTALQARNIIKKTAASVNPPDCDFYRGFSDAEVDLINRTLSRWNRETPSDFAEEIRAANFSTPPSNLHEIRDANCGYYRSFEFTYLKNTLSNKGLSVGVKYPLMEGLFKFDTFDTYDPINPDLSVTNDDFPCSLPPAWKECDPSRITLPEGVKLEIHGHYVDGGSVRDIGDWFRFDTFDHELVISLDTEFQRDGDVNDIVSYQVLAVSSGRAVEGIFYCQSGVRLGLDDIVDACRSLLGVQPKRLKMRDRKRGGGYLPAPILLMSHFGGAEWASFNQKSREALGGVLNIIRKAPASLGTVPFEVVMNKRKESCGLKVVDTTLLAPAGKGSLRALGEVVGVPKLELPDGAISRMRDFQISDPVTFAEYGVNDCRITYAYYARMHELAVDMLHLPVMPLTLGGFGVSGYREYEGSYNLLKYLGLVEVQGYRKTERVKSRGREMADGFFGPAFSGGLNVAIQGEFDDTLILDLDFTSCYPSAAALLAVPDWETARSTCDWQDFAGNAEDFLSDHGSVHVALADVDFRFPEDCRWPCIPIRAGSRGLVYPTFGSGYATTLELIEAVNKGAEINVRRMMTLDPARREDGRPILMFADYLSEMVARRREHPKESLENLMFKEIVNSFYGKLAQGVRTRNARSFDDVKPLPDSPITSPAHAGAITGIVRTALIGLIDAIEECGGTVLAATTDGAMASFPHLSHLPRPVSLGDVPGLVEAMDRKIGIKALTAGLSNLGMDQNPVEIKHAGNSAIVWKTRGYIIRDGEAAQHVARAGHRASAEDLMRFHDEDDGSLKWELKRLTSVQSIWDGKHNDLINITEVRRVNLDYDFKRIPTPDGGFRPPRDIAEFEKWRDNMEHIRKRNERATLSKVRTSVAGIKQHGGEREALKRQLLRAVVQDIGGVYPRVDDGKVTQRELADLLGVSTMDIKNAKRRSFVKLPRTELAQDVFEEIADALYADPPCGDWAAFETGVFSDI
ncbi:hypothetical protein [Celeribacter sp.]|uniref:hypothetical protein n=1 Tax=Celeribacter sp. TaxID=1890673 RepID=UPI003A8CCCC5